MPNNVSTMQGQKKLRLDALLHVSDHFFMRRYFVLDQGVDFAEVFKPAFWSNQKMNENDIIRIRAHDGSFDCELTVISVEQGGARIDFFPRYPAQFEDPNSVEAVRQKVVPIVNGKPAIRVDYMPGTLFYVIDLDGSMIARDIKKKEAAEHVMAAYLKSLGMTMPPAEEIVAAREAHEAEQKAKSSAHTARQPTPSRLSDRRSSRDPSDAEQRRGQPARQATARSRVGRKKDTARLQAPAAVPGAEMALPVRADLDRKPGRNANSNIPARQFKGSVAQPSDTVGRLTIHVVAASLGIPGVSRRTG